MQQRPATSVHRTAWRRLHNKVQVLALIRNTQPTAAISPAKQGLHFNPLSHTKEKQRVGRQKKTKQKTSENTSADDWNIFAYLREKNRSVTKLQEVYCEVSEYIKESKPCAQPQFLILWRVSPCTVTTHHNYYNTYPEKKHRIKKSRSSTCKYCGKIKLFCLCLPAFQAWWDTSRQILTEIITRSSAGWNHIVNSFFLWLPLL